MLCERENGLQGIGVKQSVLSKKKKNVSSVTFRLENGSNGAN
jgi:hypothetical protein